MNCVTWTAIATATRTATTMLCSIIGCRKYATYYCNDTDGSVWYKCADHALSCCKLRKTTF